MKTPLIFIQNRHAPGSCNRRRNERGITMVLVAVAMVAIIAMAALSIDVVTLYLARGEAQRSADAAALAAARVLSLSGVLGDPANVSGDWTAACNIATTTAETVANQNVVSGAQALSSVSFVYNGSTADCTSPSGGFAVNPQVQVTVTRNSLPTFFARIWSRGSNTVSATAIAEVFNPSGSASVSAEMIPVEPRCVKPLMVPNFDPLNISGCTTNCTGFVNRTNGTISNPGISTGGSNATGVIGERFWLTPDCQAGTSPCTLGPDPPQANYAGGTSPATPAPPTPNLQYLPGEAPSATPVAVPSCSTAGSSSPNFEPAIAGCDQSTVYQCGVQGGSPANRVDLIESPGSATNDTRNGAECLIHQAAVGLNEGQDALDTSAYPFKITGGSLNPLSGAPGQVLSASSSIVTIPIFDATAATHIRHHGSTDVTIVGFLQVFIHQVDGNGNLDVTVLNVSGCGNGTTPPGSPVLGSSPVPVRLISSP
jgi:Flp pilus assembly protein TadG